MKETNYAVWHLGFASRTSHALKVQQAQGNAPENSAMCKTRHVMVIIVKGTLTLGK